MAYRISDGLKTELERLKAKYPRDEALLLPALRRVQKEEGWVSEDALEALSSYLEIPYARVKGAMTFYSMLLRAPAGKYHLQVCRNISCHLMGAPRLLRRLEERLKIKEGETTRDGMFTISTVECLGACGTAPVLSVNGTYHENMNAEKTDRLLEELRKPSKDL